MQASEKASELHALLTQYATDDSKQALVMGREHVLRVFDELCGDVEPYQPGWATGAAPSLVLVGPEACGLLDVVVSGTGEDLDVAIELLPLRDAPFSVTAVDQWGSGGPGVRQRHVRWTFGWQGGSHSLREVMYRLEPDGRPADAEAEAHQLAALRLARLAGWPLP